MSSLERVSEDLYMCLSRCTPVHDALLYLPVYVSTTGQNKCCVCMYGLYAHLSRCTPVHDAEVARETRVLYIGKRLLLDGDV